MFRRASPPNGSTWYGKPEIGGSGSGGRVGGHCPSPPGGERGKLGRVVAMQDPARGAPVRAGARKPRNGVFSVASPLSSSAAAARVRTTLRDAFSSMDNKDLLEVAVHRAALVPRECHAIGTAGVTAAAAECLRGFADSKGPAKKERCRTWRTRACPG